MCDERETGEKSVLYFVSDLFRKITRVYTGLRCCDGWVSGDNYVNEILVRKNECNEAGLKFMQNWCHNTFFFLHEQERNYALTNEPVRIQLEIICPGRCKFSFHLHDDTRFSSGNVRGWNAFIKLVHYHIFENSRINSAFPAFIGHFCFVLMNKMQINTGDWH